MLDITYTPISEETEEQLEDTNELLELAQEDLEYLLENMEEINLEQLEELQFETPILQELEIEEITFEELAITFEETFKVAFNDEGYKIVIPLENSLAGRVADIHYLLPKYKLQIHAEHFQRVEHNLLVKKDAEIKDIKFVRSHAQAIGQCQKIIMENNYKTIISADTAGSAKELSEGKDKSIAAIASELAAEIYNLKVIKKNIEDEEGNVTRFLIMGRKVKQPEYDKNKKYITT